MKGGHMRRMTVGEEEEAVATVQLADKVEEDHTAMTGNSLIEIATLDGEDEDEGSYWPYK